MDPLLLPVLFFAGFIAAIINTISAGGSFLTLPILIFSGLDPVMANGTNRIGVFLQGLAAGSFFQKSKLIPWAFLGRILPISIIGAILGSLLSIWMGDLAFKRVLSIMMGAVTIILVFYNPGKMKQRTLPGPVLQGLFFLVGIYGGFIQAGVGFFILSIMRMDGSDLKIANIVKVLLVSIFTVFALVVFLWNGKAAIFPGLVLGAGSSLGALLGARITIHSGESFLRWFLLISVLSMSIALFFIN